MALVVLACGKRLKEREGEKTKTTMIRVEKLPKYNNDDVCCSLQSLAGLFRALIQSTITQATIAMKWINLK